VREHIEPRQIARAEGRALRTAHERTGEAIHFVDGEAVLLHAAHGGTMPYTPSRLAMKPGTSLAITMPLPRMRSAKVRIAPITAGSVSGWDQLEQVHVARRIEEVRAQETTAELLAASLEQHAMGMPEVFDETMAVGFMQRFETREQLLLGRGQLDDGFADPVALGQPLEVIVGVAASNARGGGCLHEGRRVCS
jgi:hypothetical protein